MIDLRIATWENLSDILGMVSSFHKESPYKDSEEFDEARVSEIVIECLQNPKEKIVLVLVDTKINKAIGMLIGVTTLSVFNFSKVATELAWYVNPEYRTKESVKLLDAFIYWAKNIAKCKTVHTALLENDNVNRLSTLYKRKKFVPVERAFMMVF